LPTPKPPATTIFAEVVDRGAAVPPPPENAGLGVASGLVDGHHSGLGEVGHEDPGHTQGYREQRGDLRDRLDLTAQVADALVLRKKTLQVRRIGAGAHQRLDRQLVARTRPATRHRVRAHQWLVALVAVGGVLLRRTVRAG
jgi:hypothetical protein